MTIVARQIRNRRPGTIRAMLRSAGIPTVSALARQLERPRSLVSEVISGTKKSTPVASAIAALLGTTASDLWPRLYPAASDASHPLAS